MKALAARGCRPVGIEPVAAYVATANEYLGDDGKVLQGAAESIPLPDASQDVVFCESILEDVDSPRISLDEIYRVLEPGGVAFVSTTNRTKISLSGENGEFNVPFFNWFPDSVKEGYVFEHLHYRPSLANNTPRPAVHWFTYAELCKLGRQSGFAQFYSVVDLTDEDDPALKASALRRLVLRPSIVKAFRRSPWLRALALTQVGGQVFMLKRR